MRFVPPQMDFLCFREQERVHLVIRSWAEIAASGSLAPRLTCPLSHTAPGSRWLRGLASTNGSHQEASCSAEASGGGGGGAPAFHLPSTSFPGTWLCS